MRSSVCACDGCGGGGGGGEWQIKVMLCVCYATYKEQPSSWYNMLKKNGIVLGLIYIFFLFFVYYFAVIKLDIKNYYII